MNEDILARVVRCISTSTRYPIELLTPEADLENDLGIDSVKRLEIVVALEDEFGLPLSNQERDASIRTISDIAAWVQRMSSQAKPREASENGFAGNGHQVSGVTPDNLQRADAAHRGMPSPDNSPAIPRMPNHARMSNQTNGYSDPPQMHSNGQGRAANQYPPAVAPPHFAADSPVNNGGEYRDYHDAPVEIPAQPATKPLAGRVALVTGSGRGVGRVIARVLASKGATVIVNSFHSRDSGEQTTAEIIAQGGSAVHIWGSITNPAHLDQMFSQIQSQFGRLDILICNASDGRIGSFMDLKPDDWDRAFRTNVVGHHQCAVKAAGLMRAAGGGSIVTMSAVGSKGWVGGLGSQGVVKAAVETLTRYLAVELAQYGIRANCVAGGPVYGDLLDKFPDARSIQNQWETNTPDGQLCDPMDLANAIAFLVSDEAKGINGSVWVVDHGFSAVANTNPQRVGEPQGSVMSR